MMASFRRLAAGEDGATMVEYALLIALIGAALIGVVSNLKSAISGKFTSSATAIGGS